MKTGIIGLPQVGKTSLFRILTKAHLSEHGVLESAGGAPSVFQSSRRPPRPFSRSLHPKELTHTSVEYVDVGAIGQDALKETAYIGHLRQVDANWPRSAGFRGIPAIAHVGKIDRCATSGMLNLT